MNSYFVYIITNTNNSVLYVGVTNNLTRRLYEHKNKLIDWFTSKYNLTKLIHFEEHRDIKDAIIREKQIKGWNRSKKELLVMSNNSMWQNLDYLFWYKNL